MTYFMWIDTKAGSDAMLNACVAVINPPRLHLLTFISNLYFYNLMVSKWLVQLLMIIFILLIGHYFVSLFVKIRPVFWINPSSLLLCMCGGIKIELLRFQLNQSGHSEYDSEYVDIEGDDEITQGGMVRSHSLSICRVQSVKRKWKNNLNVYGSLMTVLLSNWLAY